MPRTAPAYHEKAVAGVAAAEAFVAEADLTDYDLSVLRTERFAFQPNDDRVNLRLPRSLLAAVKAAARDAGVPYQRFIRQTLEAAALGHETP